MPIGTGNVAIRQVYTPPGIQIPASLLSTGRASHRQQHNHQRLTVKRTGYQIIERISRSVTTVMIAL